MLKLNLTMVLLFACLLQVGAQQLLTPTTGFSHKKTAYVTLKNGEEIKGNIAKLKWKKGLVKGITIVDESGKKQKLSPKEIDYMYLPPSGLDKIAKATDFLYDTQKWNNDKLNQDFLSQGYAYLETTDVKINKKTMPLLMQVLNPDFSKSVKVYHDPTAKKTASVGVGNVKLAGGNAKSYYVKLDSQKTAFLLTKKGYKKEFKSFWGKCSAVKEKYKNARWEDLPEHIVEYTEQCGK